MAVKVVKLVPLRELELKRELNACRSVINRARKEATRARRATLRTMREGGAHGLRINNVRRLFDRIDVVLEGEREE